MSHVIAEPCIATCNNECVGVCPVDCIHGSVPKADMAKLVGEERKTRLAGIQMYIDPEECTSCGACEAACPAGAIFDEDELPAEWSHYRELNARFFRPSAVS